jgi:hypothetical protein
VEAKRRRKRSSSLPTFLLGLVLALIGVGVFLLMRSYLQGAAPEPKRVVQEIHLIRPPPPPQETPPPPPPPEEKVKLPEPEQPPDPTPSNEPPPSEHLGLDAEGGAGADVFGLVGNKGGRDLLESGTSALTWYSRQLKDQIQELLSADPRTRSGSYTAEIQIWVREDGSIARRGIIKGSGKEATDRAIDAVLSRFTRAAQAPPANWINPVNLRIESHG